VRILITNDDGSRSKGLDVLFDVAKRFGTIAALTPDRDRSGAGQAITLDRPLRIRPLPSAGRQELLDGTPADCVLVGIHHLMANSPPDLVLVGVNPRPNLADGVHCSGTCGAAATAAREGIPAVAFSFAPGKEKGSISSIRPWLERFIAHVVGAPPPRGVFYNVNIPDPTQRHVGAFRVTRLGARRRRNGVDVRTDPRGREILWITGHHEDAPDEEDTDRAAVAEGFVSVTPCRCDGTADLAPWALLAAFGKEATAASIGARLVREGHVTEAELRSALVEVARSGDPLGAALARLGIFDEAAHLEATARRHCIPGVPLGEVEVDPAAPALIPAEIALRLRAVPVAFDDTTVVVATVDPSNQFVIDDIRFLTGLGVDLIAVTDTDLEIALEAYYPDPGGSP
jgi:5'-nucleotidase